MPPRSARRLFTAITAFSIGCLRSNRCRNEGRSNGLLENGQTSGALSISIFGEILSSRETKHVAEALHCASGHGSPAFNDPCGTATLVAPRYAAAPLRPCPAAAPFGFCEALSGPGFFAPVSIPACFSTLSVFSVVAGHNNSRSQ